MFSISEENLKKLNTHVRASREDWSKIVDEVLKDERRKADEYVRIREEGNSNCKSTRA